MSDAPPPEEPRLPYERDPFPKMITACIVVSMLLFFMIVIVMLADFGSRDLDRVAPEDTFAPPASLTSPEAPPEE